MQFFSYKILLILAFIALVFIYIDENRVPTQIANYNPQQNPTRIDIHKQTFSIATKREIPPSQPSQESKSAPSKKEAIPPPTQPPAETKTNLPSQKLLPPVAISVPSTTLPVSPYAPISPAPAPYAPSFQDARQYVKTVIQLRCPDILNPGQTIMGSGTIVDNNGYILTNRHLILGFNVAAGGLYASRNCTVYITSPDDLYNVKPIYIATLVSALSNYDAAVLRITKDANNNLVNPSFNFLPLATIDIVPKIGDRIFAIGYPSINDAFTITTGKAIGLETINGEDMIKIDALISAGNSGGALLDVNGQLLGIPTAGKGKESGGYALEIHDIFQWISSVIQNTKNLSSQEIISRTVEFIPNPFP